MFPSEVGTLRTPNTMDRAWARCLKAAKVKHRFTVHGLRYTFTDLIRLSKADAVVRRALTGHISNRSGPLKPGSFRSVVSSCSETIAFVAQT
jgi:integrase